VLLLQAVAVYVPPISTAFLRTVPLTAADLGVALGAGLLLFAAIEGEKWVLRRRGEPAAAVLPAGQERLA
jgi:hypothetical protein